MSRRQCKKCPWKTSTDPNDIPGGYSEKLHAGLKKTIAEPARLPTGPLHLMACHEFPKSAEKPCVGWLVHQLGPGNNIVLRLMAASGRIDANVKTVGPQHETLEDTLP